MVNSEGSTPLQRPVAISPLEERETKMENTTTTTTTLEDMIDTLAFATRKVAKATSEKKAVDDLIEAVIHVRSKMEAVEGVADDLSELPYLQDSCKRLEEQAAAAASSISTIENLIKEEGSDDKLSSFLLKEKTKMEGMRQKIETTKQQIKKWEKKKEEIDEKVSSWIVSFEWLAECMNRVPFQILEGYNKDAIRDAVCAVIQRRS